MSSCYASYKFYVYSFLSTVCVIISRNVIACTGNKQENTYKFFSLNPKGNHRLGKYE